MTWWSVDRAAGLVGWILLTASVILGLALSTRVLGGRARPAWLLDLHRGISALAVAFVGVHVAAAVADTWVGIGLADAFVPMGSPWRPGAITWGVVALYLVVAVELTSLLRRHLSHRLWHAVHLASLPLFAAATVHGVQAGTDARTLAGVATLGAATATIAALCAHRVLALGASHRDAPPDRRTTAEARPTRRATAPATAPRAPQPVGAGSAIGPEPPLSAWAFDPRPPATPR